MALQASLIGNPNYKVVTALNTTTGKIEEYHQYMPVNPSINSPEVKTSGTLSPGNVATAQKPTLPVSNEIGGTTNGTTGLPVGGGSVPDVIQTTNPYNVLIGGDLPETWGSKDHPEQDIDYVIKQLKKAQPAVEKYGGKLQYDVTKGELVYNDSPLTLITGQTDGTTNVSVGGGSLPDGFKPEIYIPGTKPEIETGTIGGGSGGSSSSTTTQIEKETISEKTATQNNTIVYIAVAAIVLLFVFN